ncbi:trophoblast glycoprotein-like isoform X2 [Antennarius striatus]|uniref:trophoblast glycoprotein-like isoform X2 n=1 Tax=Antennarius striatus TaxID=241820 RepID=UPI0035B02359
MCVFRVELFLGVLFWAPYQCLECPFGCECFAINCMVKCVSKDLIMVPQSFPDYARTVIITGNNIQQIGPESLAELENVTNVILSNNRITQMASRSFSALLNLHFLDLSGNRLALIHPEALSIPSSPLQELNLSCSLYNSSALTDLTTVLRWGGLRGLLRLDLSGNNLVRLPPGMFAHLPNLQHLLLSNNTLMAIYSQTFSGISRLQLLDLRRNAFRTFMADALQELEMLGNIQILLGDNPYTCSCEIHSFLLWLNESRGEIDVDSVRCALPRDLSDARLQGLSEQAIGCVVPVQDEVADLTLQTSYVFLGLVLGFVGMVFLFVLYLNRKGMKKWIIEMRDACRDVIAGYHYRYEIDSDPRLGHISEGNSGSRAQKHLGLDLSSQIPNDTCIIHVPADTHLKQSRWSY